MVYYASKTEKACQQFEMNMLLKYLMYHEKKPATKIIYSKKNDAYYVVSDDTKKKAV